MIKRSQIYLFILSVLSIIALNSCSTVKVLPENSSRLKKNLLIINKGNNNLTSEQLKPYIRQKSNNYYIFGWNPFLSIYNWGDGSGSGWDKLTRKIGQAPVEFDSTLVVSSKKNILNHLQTLGFYNSHVDSKVIIKGRKTKVKYFVFPGKEYFIYDIEHKIEDSLLRSLVLSTLKYSHIKVGDKLSENVLNSEVERLTSLIRDNGYFDFTSNYISFLADTLSKKDSTKLTILINNYTRNEDAKDAKPHKQFYIKNVTIYSNYSGINNDNSSLNQVYDTITLFEQKIISNKSLKIRERFLEKINRIKPKKRYNESDVKTTYNRFNDLRIYNGVSIEFKNSDFSSTKDSSFVDCIIRLTPSKPQGYSLNLEASNNSNSLFGISPAVNYFHKNLFGGGELLNLGLMGNFQFNLSTSAKSSEFGVSSSISIPKFLLISDSHFNTLLPRTEISALYSFNDRPEFRRNLISFKYGYNWVYKKVNFNYNLIQLNVVNLFNLSEDFYESLDNPFLRNAYKNYFDLGAGFTMFYSKIPNIQSKNSNFYFRWSSDLAGNLLSLFNNSLPKEENGSHTIWSTPYSQYIKSELTLVYNNQLSSKLNWVNRFVGGVGYAYGNSVSIPFEKLFFSGGANSMRGWHARTLGPGNSEIDNTFSIPNQTGDVKLELNSELRFPLFKNFEGALFIDAGNVWTIKRELEQSPGDFMFNRFYRQIAVDWGAGLRLNLDFVVIRLDLGIKEYNPVTKLWNKPADWFNNGSYTLQFGVGYPF